MACSSSTGSGSAAFRSDLRAQPGAAREDERAGREGQEGQAGDEGEDHHDPGHRGERGRLAADLRDDLDVDRALAAAARQQEARGDGDDDRRDLRDEPVADRQDRVGLDRLTDRHAMRDHPGREADDQIEDGDQQARDGVALHELRGTVERAEERRLGEVGLAAALGLLVIDRARRHVAVDGELLAGHPVQREARADLGHPRRALGDDHEVHDQQHAEHHEPERDGAAHDEAREALDDVAGRVGAGMALDR